MVHLPFGSQIRDMNEALDPVGDLNERAEFRQVPHGAFDDLANGEIFADTLPGIP